MTEYTEKQLTNLAGLAFGQIDTGFPIIKSLAINELGTYLGLDFNDEQQSVQVPQLKLICENCLLKSPLKELLE